MNDPINKAVSAKIGELETMTKQINELRAQHKKCKDDLVQSLAFFGLQYVPCRTCQSSGSLNGKPCPDCGGMKVQLIPLDGEEEDESQDGE